MEINNCTDINGIALNEVKFNVDGTVVGVLDVDGNQTTSNLSYECCIANDWVFDPTDTKCYWAPSCLEGDSYNIILNPEGDSGAIFQVDESEKDFCKLEVEFDWLLRFDCEVIDTPLKTILENLNLEVKVEKVIFDESLPIPNNLELVEKMTLFKIEDIATFFSGNTNTGISLKGDCDVVKNSFLNDLNTNSDVISELSLNSDWVKLKFTIEDPIIIEKILNERLVISLTVNSLYNFSILIDNVELNKIVEPPVLPKPKFSGVECPKFDVKRVVDNKKSWVNNSGFNDRKFDLDLRKSKYTINDDKLVINSKEIELSVNSSKAIDDDILDFVKLNECILSPSTGCTNDHKCVDLTPLITIPLTEIDGDDFLNMLIDVKNRKTISTYPTLDLLYYRYRNSLEHCGVNRNSLNSESINRFVDLLGSYWIDLLEQLIPATTIWGASQTSGNNVFSGNGTNKYKYKKYSTLVCDSISYSVPSPTSGSTNVNVISEYTTSDSVIRQECDLITIKQINNGSEFIGTVSIIGEGEISTDGSVISITESIDDSCDLFNVCE